MAGPSKLNLPAVDRLLHAPTGVEMSERKNVRFALAVLFSINAMNFYDRLIPGAVGPGIQKAFDLKDWELGALGTAFILLYATIGIPLGRISDRFSRRKILAAGVFVWSLLTAASGLAQSFVQLIVLRLLVGVGEATCAPASTSLIGDLYPAKQRSKALAIFMLGLPIGTASCFFLSVLIETMAAKTPDGIAGWRWAFLMALIPGLLCAIGAWFIREPQRGATEQHQVGSLKREGSPYWLVLKTPTMIWIILSGALHNFNMNAMGSFLVLYLRRVHEAEPLMAGSLSACIFGLAGIPGLFVGGYLGDRVSRKNGRMVVAAVAVAIATPFMYFGFAHAPGAPIIVSVLLGISCMMLYVYYSTVYSTIQDVVEPSLRATAMALYFFAMYLLGGALGPLGLGMLSDHFRDRAIAGAGVSFEGLSKDQLAEAIKPFAAQGLQSASMVLPIISVLLAIVLAAGARTVTGDSEKLRQWMAKADEQPKN